MSGRHRKGSGRDHGTVGMEENERGEKEGARQETGEKMKGEKEVK